MSIDLNKVFSEKAMYCEIHPAYDPTNHMPVTKGCRHCMLCRFVWILGNYKTDEARQEALDRLERLAHHIAESVDNGTFNHNILKPKVTVEKKDS